MNAYPDRVRAFFIYGKMSKKHHTIVFTYTTFYDSLVFEKEKTILCLKLIQLIVNHGGKYNTKVSENQYYVKDEADDPEKYGTRYHHFVEVMGENQGTKVLSYADLFAILETSWEELENMDLPKLPEDDRNKGSYVYSTVNVKGTTIGEILASKGVLSKLDNEE